MSFVRKLTKSRDTLLDMLELRGFNVEPFKHFSTEEVNVMYKNSTKASKEMNPIDFVATGDENEVHVKYLFNSKPRVANLISLVESMVDEIIEDGDTLIILIKDPVSNDQSLEIFFEELYQSRKIFVQYFWIDMLMFNISQHKKVPKHEVLSEKQKEEFIKSLDIKSESQLPYINKTDPVAKFMGMKTGQICKITRPSETAGTTNYYRLCKL